MDAVAGDTEWSKTKKIDQPRALPDKAESEIPGKGQ